MIDAHVHLDDEQYGNDPAPIIERAAAAGVTAMLSAGVHLTSGLAAIAIAERYSGVYAAVGFHPHEASLLRPEDLNAMREVAAHPKVVAIGEIGLDYYRDLSPRDVQQRALRAQLDLAAELAMPVVVHTREVGPDMYAVLSAWAAEASPQYHGRPLGMMHCFSEDAAAALRYVDLGFHISLAGPITYPNGGKTRAVAVAVPLDRLLAETDSPYLPPQSHRGQRNEPAHVAAVVQQIATERGLPAAAVATQTVRNAAALFGLPVVA